MARTEDEFVEIALKLGSDLGKLASLRAGMRERMLKSKLCDHVNFTRNLEKKYRELWERYCRGDVPSLSRRGIKEGSHLSPSLGNGNSFMGPEISRNTMRIGGDGGNQRWHQGATRDSHSRSLSLTSQQNFQQNNNQEATSRGVGSSQIRSPQVGEGRRLASGNNSGNGALKNGN